MVAKKNLEEDELVLQSNLLAACALEGHTANLCGACYKISATPLQFRCPRCKQVYFCNAACQNNVDGDHAMSCLALRKWKGGSKLDSQKVSLLRLLLQVYVACFKFVPAGKKVNATTALAKLRCLHFHEEAWDASERKVWQKPFAFFLQAWRSAKVPWTPSIKDLRADIGRIECNVFSLYEDASGALVGHAVYPSVGIALNHSCAPNCYADDKGVKVLKFFATHNGRGVASARAVSAGEELCISYVDVKMPVGSRRRALKEQYHFECKCAKCEDDINWDFRKSLLRSRLHPLAFTCLKRSSKCQGDDGPEAECSQSKEVGPETGSKRQRRMSDVKSIVLSKLTSVPLTQVLEVLVPRGLSPR